MGTYNLTKGDTAIAALDFGRFFCARIPIVVEDIIAANATLLAAEKITAADVIQLWDVPDNVTLLPGLASLEISVAGTAANTVNVGIAGSNEMFSGVSIATAGVVFDVADDATWGTDNYGSYSFVATDTIDMTFVADEVTGEFYLYIPGFVRA